MQAQAVEETIEPWRLPFRKEPQLGAPAIWCSLRTETDYWKDGKTTRNYAGDCPHPPLRPASVAEPCRTSSRTPIP